MIAFRVVIRLGVMGFVLLFMEGFLHRDPWVDLGNGYNIGAPWWGAPMQLWHFRSRDPREYSEWYTLVLTDESAEDSVRYVVENPNSPHESFELASEEEWRRVRRERKATFMPEAVLGDEPIEGITEFKKNERYAIAPYTGGYFLLDTEDDRLRVWTDRAEWEEAARSIAGMTTEGMRDPLSWWEQYWDSTTWTGVGILAAVMLPWVVWPIFRRGPRTIPSAG
jgi:hypothetical protein